MRFTDGFWLPKAGVTPLFAQHAYDVTAVDESLVVHAPTKRIVDRGDTLNRALLTVTLSSPLENVVRVRVEHFQGEREQVSFSLPGATDAAARAAASDSGGTLTTEHSPRP